ncbi:MAG: ester cyclase [Betaproteobacteria bacterium]|nr:ester cyclase [Pseudomonadota bacterium]
MNELKNRAFALINTWTTAEVTSIAGMLDAGFEEIDHPQPTARGLTGLRDKLALFHKVHSNVAIRVRKQIEQGDIVCIQWLLTAQVRGATAGPDEAPLVVYQPAISWVYFANGKIVRHRLYRDIVGYLVQRGYKWSEAGAKNATEKEPQP